LFLLSKLKCTSLTVSTCERVITRFFFTTPAFSTLCRVGRAPAQWKWM